MESLGPILGPIGILAVFGWMLKTWMTNRRIQNMAAIQADIQKHLIDKFDSVDEMKIYLDSDAGNKLMTTLAPEKSSPLGRILGSIQSGLILSLSGLAFLFIRAQTQEVQFHESFALLFLGGLSLALGIGFLLSATASYYLSKNWGLVNGHSRSEG